jgi:histidine phosphotransferase ChpT
MHFAARERPLLEDGERQPQKPAMSDLELGALLVSRVCHDLISPVAAISNGMEILADEQDADMRKHALTLIEHSVGQAKARLLFARLAFGAMGSAGAEIDLREVRQVAADFFKTGKAKLDWQAPAIALDKEIIRVLLNLSAMGADCIPRGGALTVKVDAAKSALTLSVAAKGIKANLAPDIREGLELKTPLEDLTGRTIAPYVTALLVRKLGGTIAMTHDGELVRFEARFERKG